MISCNQIDQKLSCLNNYDLIFYFWELKLLKRELICGACGVYMNFVPYKKNIDKFAWRCMNRLCVKHKEYISVRKNSFFEKFCADLRIVLKVILKIITKQPQSSILSFFNSKRTLITKICKEFYNLIPVANFENDKFGGYGCIVQIDETMLNYKCKSHKGRSPTNRTDALCIVEVRNGIKRGYACVIPNKESDTLIPIIERMVYPGTIIWTDEHRSYGKLREEFNHSTVCHKYEFVNSIDGTNTQAIESFNNELKLQIKREKDVFTRKRADFLKRFIFFFNNSERILEACLELIKC